MNFNPLDQQLKNPGLLIREELIPNRIHILKSLPDLVFRYCLVLFVGFTPGGDDDFRRTEQATNMINDVSLDFTCREPIASMTAIAKRWSITLR